MFIHTILPNRPTDIGFYTHFTNEELKTQRVKWITQGHIPSKQQQCLISLSGVLPPHPTAVLSKWLQEKNWIVEVTKKIKFGATNLKFHFLDGQSKFVKFNTFSLCIKITFAICEGPLFLLTHGNYIFTLQLQIWFLVFPFCFHKHTFTANCSRINSFVWNPSVCSGLPPWPGESVHEDPAWRGWC